MLFSGNIVTLDGHDIAAAPPFKLGNRGSSAYRCIKCQERKVPKSVDSFELIRDVLIGLVRREGRDLTARQLSIFLIIYRENAMHTVRELADRLDLRCADITRAADRLEELDLLKRKSDPRDRRSVVLSRTGDGAELLKFMGRLIRDSRAAFAAREAEEQTPGGT
jgi:DNA-binding MarR family transcriptional regulator